MRFKIVFSRSWEFKNELIEGNEDPRGNKIVIVHETTPDDAVQEKPMRWNENTVTVKEIGIL